MSDQTLRVILQDDGSSPEQAARTATAPEAGRNPGPADRQPVTGPKARHEKSPDGSGDQPGTATSSKPPRDTSGPSIGASLEKAASIFGEAIGAGGLTKTVLELRKAFLDLYRSVNKPAPRPDIGGNRVGETKRRPDSSVTGPPAEKSETVLAPSGPPPKGTVTGPTKRPTGDVTAAKDTAVDAEIVGPGAAGSRLATLAAAAGPAAVAVATLTAAAVAGGVAIKKVADGLDSEAHRLAKFSPQLAGATASNDIRLLFADFRRANQIGPQLARFENRFGRGQEALMDIQTQMLKVLLEIEEELAPLIEAAISTAKTTADWVPVIAKVALDTAKIADPKIRLIVDAITIIARIAKRWAPKEEDGPKIDPFMQAFLANFDGPNPIRAGRMAAMPGGMP